MVDWEPEEQVRVRRLQRWAIVLDVIGIATFSVLCAIALYGIWNWLS
jgi:hypothetical protein